MRVCARALDLVARLERLSRECVDCADAHLDPDYPFQTRCSTCGGHYEVVDAHRVAELLGEVRLVLHDAATGKR